MELSQKIANWIKKQVETADKKGIIVGMSGGIDSAVVAVLAKKALGDNVLGLMLPCKSNPKDEKHALKVASKFNIKTKKVDLCKIFDDFSSRYPDASALAKANLKPRLRMVTLYYFANIRNYLVAGTGNKSELSVGYFTKHGDGGVDILPLGDLLKSEVVKLAQELSIPDEIIKRPPSAGLWEGQTDEDEMGITYEELDKIVIAIEKNRTQDINDDKLLKVKKMMRDSEHKRAAAPIFKNK